MTDSLRHIKAFRIEMPEKYHNIVFLWLITTSIDEEPQHMSGSYKFSNKELFIAHK